MENFIKKIPQIRSKVFTEHKETFAIIIKYKTKHLLNRNKESIAINVEKNEQNLAIHKLEAHVFSLE